MRIATMTMVLLASTMAWAAATPEQKCQGGKNEAAGMLAACLAKAEKKLITGGDLMKYSEALAKCSDKFQSKWQKLEQKAVDAMTTCPTTTDQADVENFVAVNGAIIAAALQSGGALPECGDNLINVAGEQCDGSALGGETCASLGFLGGTLACASCQFNTSACTVVGLPASGQTTAYGAGSDGDLEPGATMSFTDNGDGTVTDNRTGLMWEKKDDSGTTVHDKDNTYTWGLFTPPYTMNGTMVTTFLATLNGGGGFAGHTDWRIPNIKEVMSIVDYEILYPGPMVSAAFHQTATCTGCMDVTAPACSCTAPARHWSSTTYSDDPGGVYILWFDDGGIYANGKTAGYHVRAVRGGL